MVTFEPVPVRDLGDRPRSLPRKGRVEKEEECGG